MTQVETDGLRVAALAAHEAEEAERQVRANRQQREQLEWLEEGATAALADIIGTYDAADTVTRDEHGLRADVAGLELRWYRHEDAEKGAWYAELVCPKCDSVAPSPPITRLAQLGRVLSHPEEIGVHECRPDPEATRPESPRCGVRTFRTDEDTYAGLQGLERFVGEWDETQIVAVGPCEVLAVGRRLTGF